MPELYTPPPYKVEPAIRNLVDAAEITDLDGVHICTVSGEAGAVKSLNEARANADFIVKACNAWHDPKALRSRLIEMGW